MLIATFGPGTSWAGKTISFENEQFVLEGHGPITAADVMEYDRQGQLVWASEGMRAWVGGRAHGDKPARLVATFNSSTGWAGKTITFDEERFTLEGHGAVTAADLMQYDAQGYLAWASESMRGWVGARAAATPRLPATAASSANHYMTPWGEVSMLGVAGLFLLVSGLIIVVYYIGFFDTSVPVDTGGYFDIERVNNIGLMNDQRNGIIGGVLAMVGGGVLLFVEYTRGGLRRSPRVAAADERKCPYCAETIKADAVVCRFCNRDLSPPGGPGPAA